jgi:hypothetical protein
MELAVVIAVFSDMTPCTLANFANISEEIIVTILRMQTKSGYLLLSVSDCLLGLLADTEHGDSSIPYSQKPSVCFEYQV